MNRNSPANSAPAARPGQKVPSRSNSGVPRIRAQNSRHTAAMAERTPACITSDMSAAASLAATWLKPQMKQHITMRESAVLSRGLRSIC